MSEQPLAVRERKGIVGMLEKEEVRAELSKVLPPDRNIDELIARAKVACLSNPDLMECDMQSLLLAIKKSVALGLDLNGRDAHLVPFYDKKAGKKKAQFIVDAKGYIKLGIESGMKLITSDLVCERDNFRLWTDDAGRHLLHSIDHRQPRGKVLGAYSYAQNASGSFDYEYMTIAEIDAIKARSKASFGPWVTDENEMRRKTVIRRHSKRWPLGSRVWLALAQDDDRLPEIEAKKVSLIMPDEVAPAIGEPPKANLIEANADVVPADQDGAKEEEW